MGPLMTITAPVLLLALARDWLDHTARAERKLARRRREQTWDNPAFDYGATTTLRLTYAQNRYLHYFQKSDADFSNKLIERKLLDQIERFLEEHGIDTTDIRDRQMTILNSGILVQGGDVRAEALAVGQGAQARKTDGMHPGRSKEAAD
jgi:hypothetical protein